MDEGKLDRDNAIAQALVDRLIDAFIGRGFTLRCSSPDPAWNKAAEAWWSKWFTEQIDVRGLANGAQFLRVRARAIAVDGDVGVIRLLNGQMQLVESDRVRTPFAKNAGSRYVNGVEIDGLGRPVNFHVAERPGQTWIADRGTRVYPISPAHFDFGVNPLHQRIQQTRGEPILTAALPLLEQIDDLIVATVVAARMSAYVALAIESSDPAAMQQALLGQSNAADPDLNSGSAVGAAQQTRWEPGGVLHLKVGEKVVPIDPKQPTQQFHEQIRALIRLVAASIGLPFELAMLDSSEVTYHGFKASIGNAYRGFERWQQETAGFLQRTFQWRIAMAILDRELPYVEGWNRARFLPPPPPIIDPKAEYEALALAVNQRLKSRTDAVGSTFGTDIDDLYGDLDRELSIERDKNIGPVALPGQAGAAPGVRAPEDTSTTPDARVGAGAA